MAMNTTVGRIKKSGVCTCSLEVKPHESRRNLKQGKREELGLAAGGGVHRGYGLWRGVASIAVYVGAYPW